jgi:hypothetical protein
VFCVSEKTLEMRQKDIVKGISKSTLRRHDWVHTHFIIIPVKLTMYLVMHLSESLADINIVHVFLEMESIVCKIKRSRGE